MAGPIEQHVTIAMAEGPFALDGVYLAGEREEARGTVVAPPHPLFGGSMQSPVVNEIAYACAKAGIPSLRFDWRGVGASAGAPSGEQDEADEDYSAALVHLEETVSGPLIAAGYSFGACAAARSAARHPRVQRLVLVSPPVPLLDAKVLAAFPGGVLVVSGENDEYSPAAELEALVDPIEGLELRFVPDADHFYMSGLAEISRALEAWL